MALEKPSTPAPADLRAAYYGLPAVTIHETDTHRISYRYCRDLGLLERPDNYTWGYHIFRTSYSLTSDADFQNAIDVLHEYMHYVSYMGHNSHLEELQERGLNGSDMVDERPNQQLWQRLRNDIVQDREQLEGASPAKVRALARDWAYSLGSKTYTSPSYRFCLLIDEESMETLLKHPMPAVRPPHISLARAVKVIDVEFGLQDSYHSDFDDSDSGSDNDENDVGTPGLKYEGWFFASASKLMELWLSDSELDQEGMYTWDSDQQPLHKSTSMSMPVNSSTLEISMPPSGAIDTRSRS